VHFTTAAERILLDRFAAITKKRFAYDTFGLSAVDVFANIPASANPSRACIFSDACAEWPMAGQQSG